MTNPYSLLESWQSWADELCASYGIDVSTLVSDDDQRERIAAVLRQYADNLTATQTRSTQQLLMLRASCRLWRLLGKRLGEPQHEMTADGPCLSWFWQQGNACLSFWIDGRDLMMLALKDSKACEVRSPTDDEIVGHAERLFELMLQSENQRGE